MEEVWGPLGHLAGLGRHLCERHPLVRLYFSDLECRHVGREPGFNGWEVTGRGGFLLGEDSRWYSSRQSAERALSDFLINRARKELSLPELKGL